MLKSPRKLLSPTLAAIAFMALADALASAQPARNAMTQCSYRGINQPIA